MTSCIAIFEVHLKLVFNAFKKMSEKESVPHLTAVGYDLALAPFSEHHKMTA